MSSALAIVAHPVRVPLLHLLVAALELDGEVNVVSNRYMELDDIYLMHPDVLDPPIDVWPALGARVHPIWRLSNAMTPAEGVLRVSSCA